VLAVDFARPMLERGAAKLTASQAGRVQIVQADGRRLPAADASVASVTIAFGIRNIRPRSQALEEIFRVLAPGGRLCVLEFGSGKNRIWGGLYNFYLRRLLPLVGRMVSRDPEAYTYLAETIADFPTARELGREMQEAGFGRVLWQPLLSGICWVHVAEKPA
jgi:demethylmenaquinone methyltransferase/2-methoxy-6-polyprenyl-1,4-benzoquinol methylase